MYVYVTDETNTLRGVVDLRQLIVAEPEQMIGEVMTDNVISLNPDDTLQDAVDMIGRYGFRAIPVTDNDERLLGVVSFVMQREHIPGLSLAVSRNGKVLYARGYGRRDLD
ncbi:MAG: hypothetical protein B7X10_06680, partial [Burkholderiales bacterium 21-58-4]